ncbi:hypothetical protein Tco_0959959 [Tanacetum coccineum]
MPNPTASAAVAAIQLGLKGDTKKQSYDNICEKKVLTPIEIQTMAPTSKLDSTREGKGKMIVTEPEITVISDLRPIFCNKTHSTLTEPEITAISR